MNKELLDLTNPQKSILYTEQFYNGTAINNICGTAIIKNTLDFEVLKEAINIVAKNNASFNLKLVLENNEAKQFLQSFKPLDIEIVDLDSVEGISTLENKLMSHVFDIYSSSNLFEFKIFRFPDRTGGFMLNIHHLFADSWTLGLTAREIVRVYSSLVNNEPINNDNFCSYIDYIYSEKEYLSSDKFKKDTAYWDSVFSTIPEVASIPGSFSDLRSISSCSANRKSFSIDKKDLDRIDNFCKDNKVSIFNFFMAVYSIYIGRVSGLDDFVIATPILNRTNFKEKNTSGMFINIAPLRINIDNTIDFKSFVSNIAKDSLAMLRHQKYYYQSILEDLRKRDSSLPNLYNILISYQVTKANTEDGLTYNTRWAFNGNTADDIDIHLYDINDTGSIDIAYDYKIAKYSEEDIEAIHNRILYIINQVIATNDIAVDDIEIVTKDEKNEILNNFNDTSLKYDENMPFISYFEKQVELYPDNIALTFHGEDMSYYCLNERANSLAYLLRNSGVTNNSIVGIMVERSFEMIISILAVLKSGGAYIPIDPDYPDDRINYMVKDSKMAVLLTKVNSSKKINCANIIYTDLNQDFYLENKSNLDSISNASDLSYLIYTSGSTGLPKGVMLTQKSLCNFYHATKEKFYYLSDNKTHSVISITTVSFDIFAFETLISLANGLHLFMTDNFEQKSTLKLEKLIRDNKIEIIQSTPSVMRFHLDNLEDSNNFSSLKCVILAGEQLPLDLVSRIKNISNDCIIYNGYGPSETTIFSSVQDVTNLDKINIGKPIANTQFYILDEKRHLLPKHHIGEIYISGYGLGNGYLGKPDLTNKGFLPNPFIPDTLFYKTGDLGLWLDDGCIECKGRIDHQIKLRGLRIELEEIEHKINTFKTGIKSAVVVRNENQTDYLYAFIEAKNNVDTSVLKSYLMSCLPNYMVPSYFIILDKLPQTPNGKIDHKALKTYPISHDIKNIKKVLPKSEIEQFLYDSICNIMHNSSFSMSDNLFSIGMDSLSIIILSNNIEKKYNLTISVKELYSVNSLIELANLIKNSSFKNNKPEICSAPINDSYPLTNEQLSIFYAIKMSPENSLLYNVSGGIVIDNVLNKGKVEQCFQQIVNRHSSFRTCFKFMDQEPRQVVLDSIDFSVETCYGNSSQIDEIISSFPKPFLLESAPLLRVCLCYLENDKTLLLLDTHHIIMDGISLNILLDDFCNIYEGIELSQKNLRYIDFASWEKDYMHSFDACIQKSYWIDKFKSKEIPILSLPYDYTPSTVSSAGNTLQATISEDVFTEIEKIAKQENVSTYMVFLSIFYLLLYNYTSQENIFVGIPIANRTSDSLQNVIGMFVNSAILDVTVDSNLTFSKFLKEVKKVVLDTMEHQPYPYNALVKNLNLNGKNLFDVMFVYQNEIKENFSIDGDPIEIIYANTHSAKFNLSLEVLPFTRTIKLEYRTDLFTNNTMACFLQHYLHLLENVNNYLSSKISSFDILPEGEKNTILHQFNDTFLPFDEEKDMVDLFEDKAKNFPNSIAVIFEEHSYTYDELNKRANSMAHYLISLNITNNDIVAILLNRSFDLVVAIYAVLKCGASYVLIDPTLPKERINYIIENSNSTHCVTNSNLSDLSNISYTTIDNFDFSHVCVDNLYNISRSKNLCIIYTSGSTGKPKGVVLHKLGFVNLLYAFDKEMDISKYSNILGIATVSFDMFCVELFSALSFGNTLILANEEEQKNVIAMSSLIKNNNVDFFVTTPSRAELLLLDECNNPLKNVKAFQLGGEKFSPTLYEKLHKFTNAKIFNGYGPTEITACCSNKLVTSSDITIGKPLGNVQIYICDSNMKLCPIGVVGEICVAGYGVSNGYLHNSETTSKSFINNPFGKGYLYKTGDLGKFKLNGEIEYIGRSDCQIKIRGLRIELSEIEVKLNCIDTIEQSVVLYKNDCKFPYLTAFVVSKDTINVHDIKTKLSQSLPAYMIPRYIIQLDELPITLNGKVDRKILDNYKLPTNELDARNNYTPPKTDKQKLFCQIWSSLLNLEVGIDDDLFDIGADSLLAIRFKTQLLSYDIDLPYADIFKYHTIRQLCNVHALDSEKKNSLNEFNYLDINTLLSNQSNSEITYASNHNILLLGSTGFIGMHIIDSFIKNCTGKIYCIVREKNKMSTTMRFMDLLHFYFGNNLDKFIDNRIFILKGNVLKDNFALSNQVYKSIVDDVDTVINAAANVKHFGSDDNFKNINIDALNIAINFCLNHNKRLIHLSSLSISGNMMLDGCLSENSNLSKKTFAESDLFIGQTLDNVYSRSKFEAERLILDKIVNQNLNAQILRLGNITSRYSDGKFQINTSDNAFVNRLKSFIVIKALPEYLLNNYAEFTPVDLCADAIINVINYHCKNRYVYHIYDDNHLYFFDLLKFFKTLKFDVNILSEDDFSKKVTALLSNEKSLDSLSGIVNDFSTDRKLDYSSHIEITSFDSKKLLKLGNFVWPKIDFEYIKKYISYLQKIKFID